MPANVTDASINLTGVKSAGDFAINRCGSCATPLALRAPTSISPASTWLCRRCGSVYFARCQEREGQTFAAGARLVSYQEVIKAVKGHIEGNVCSIPPKDIQRLVKCFAARNYQGRDTREHKRHPAAVRVTAIPLSADFRIVGQPASIITMNLSGGGSALIHTKRILEPLLAIDFSAAGIELLPAILEVTRVRTLAQAFEIAGKFVSRILH
jgi:hypothetical protein